jgi:cell division protein FtsZ
VTGFHPSAIKVRVVGIGGAGGNAVMRMTNGGLHDIDVLALNTDAQALGRLKHIRTFAIGPNTTSGMGSGGQPEIGRKAIRESQEQVAELLQGSDMVFITAGMGGGTGTGAASTVADVARKQSALTVAVVTLPFSFEGPRRRSVAEQGLNGLQQKVDTLIVVENDKLLPSLKGKVTLDRAFEAADEVLMQGVQGISDIVTVPGLINVDFADVKAIMSGGGRAFMAVGEAKGKWAAMDAARLALSNPLFNAPLEGATGILFNITGGKDLTLGQVHEVAGIIRKAARSDTNVMFGVVQDKKMKKRVSITLVATGVGKSRDLKASEEGVTFSDSDFAELLGNGSINGRAAPNGANARRLL